MDIVRGEPENAAIQAPGLTMQSEDFQTVIQAQLALMEQQLDLLEVYGVDVTSPLLD